ncbi:hypothetical protein AGLY_005717 [Aphis glycines]|uniref:MULE transposase domain-containing protein n=1 Tax=Aphis glycines TaxID=307491 RepID=A0A6G0TU08_APHGL|nr:hypothetical protein AGLY_005717 [Aphis glycines]
MLSVICAKCPNCEVVQITIDFEKAVVIAIEKVLPKVKIHCCYFHLCQSVWRKIQEYGLVKKYKEDKQFQRDIAMITGLAFLPVNYMLKKVWKFYMKNVITKMLIKFLRTLIQLMLTVAIGIKKITPLLFPPSMRNVFELTKAGIDRTNNISEGWNNKLATLLRINHPNIWLFIEALQMSHLSASIKILNYRSGAFRSNLGKDDRLKKLCESFSNDI